MPEVIIYKGNQIHKFSDDCYVAYVMHRYEEIENYERATLEAAKEVIDKHTAGQNEI